MDEQKTLTVKELCRVLRIGQNSVYNLIHSNSFPVVKVGHSYRIPSDSFYEWLEGNHIELAAKFDR